VVYENQRTDDVTDVNLTPTIEYYRAKLAEHGPGAKGMDWKDESAQRLRFEGVARHIDFAKKPSVLDVGCGSGAFVDFCRERGFQLHYTGIDVCPEMVAACNERHGAGTARLATAGDLATWTEQFDYVMATGTFNTKFDASELQWREFFHANLRAMFRVCRLATVVNMISCFVDYRYDRLYYATPDEIARLAIEHMSRRFLLDHSYSPYDMTAVFYRHE
jgi:cyclopropane fatty-acyl-phospholipid synthase-like methyltransferase